MKTKKILSKSNVKNLRAGETEDLKVALVTGASGLIGSAVCLALAKRRWKIGLVSHRKDARAAGLLRKIRSLGGRAAVVSADLLNARATAPRAAAEIQAQLGPVHLLVHAAGLPVISSDWAAPPEDLERHFALNVTAFLALASALLPEMLRAQNGTFIALLSQAVTPPAIPGWQAYSIAKAALGQAVSELCAAYGQAGIRSLSVLPGALKGPPAPASGQGSASAQALRRRWPIGLEPSAVGELIASIAEDSGFANGTSVKMDARLGTENGLWLPWAPEGNPLPTRVPASLPNADPALGKLRSVFRETFGLDSQESMDEAKIGDLQGWDSLGHIRLIMEIESAFGVSFTNAQAAKLQSFSDIAQALARHAKK